MNIKKTKLMIVMALLAVIVCTMVACGQAETTTDRTPRDLREGYIQQFDGFKSTVCWTRNDITGYKIYGRLFTPDGFSENKKYPIAIISHGYNAVSEDGTSKIVQNFISQGVLCYTYDFCGGGRMVKSEGTSLEMSVKSEISDLEHVMAFVQSMPFCDSEKLVLCGRSFGGLVTALTAAKHKDEAAGVVLFFPALSTYDGAHRTYNSLDEVPEKSTVNYLEVGKKYYQDIWDVNPYEIIAGYDKNLLILHGDNDESVPLSYSEKALTVYAENQAKLVVVDGAGHNFTDADYAVVTPHINDYLQSMQIVT